MTDNAATRYAVDINSSLSRQLGSAAPQDMLDDLVAAGAGLDAAIGGTGSQWQAATDQWKQARAALTDYLSVYLTDGLPAIPGLDALVGAIDWESVEGLAGGLDLGPLKLKLASSSLNLQTALGSPLTVGPFQPLGIAAEIALPIGAGPSGGGSILRLPEGAGFGGTLNIPLGPVSVDATAILERSADGLPSFLAVMGVGFTPPIQLSFGFSLDRVGGIVGVHRRIDADALAIAIRTGAAGNALFAAGPPAAPASLIEDLRRYFPASRDRHVVGPTLRLGWLSMGSESFLALDLGVMIELPSFKVALLGVARAAIPAAPGIINLRLDLLGVLDPAQCLTTIDASLVDSHALGIFSVFGDAAMRMSWGSQPYSVLSIGGFYPGFNPEPARLPALRRVGMALEAPTPGIRIRAEGYLAVTSNTIQLGGRLDVTISMGMSAHGFLEVNALIQFRPFYFVAECSAGFDVRVSGFSFAGVRLDGTISGPGPMVVHGKLTIDVLMFDFSWNETIKLGGGQRDAAKITRPLLDILAEEITDAGNYRAAAANDPAVVLEPRGGRPGIAAVPPTGALQWSQRRAPLGLPIDRVDGQPLGSPEGVVVASSGAVVRDSFSPGSYCTLTKAERLNRPPFDTLDAGVVLTPGVATAGNFVADPRVVDVVVILGSQSFAPRQMAAFDLGAASGLVSASSRPAALSNTDPMISATREVWATVQRSGDVQNYETATAAFQFAKSGTPGSVAMSAVDAGRTIDLGGL
jgi:hypothetical protein